MSKDISEYYRSSNGLRLELIGSNVLAGTWILSSVLRAYDHGKIMQITYFDIKKGRNSFDLSLLIEFGGLVLNLITAYVLYLRGERKNIERHREIMSALKLYEEELLPIKRGAKFVVIDKRARLSKMMVNNKEISKKTVDIESFKQLGLDKDDDKLMFK